MAAAVPSCVQFMVQFGAESEEAARTVGARLACRSAVVLQPHTFSPLGRRDGSHCNGYTVTDGVAIAVTDGSVSLQASRSCNEGMDS